MVLFLKGFRLRLVESFVGLHTNRFLHDDFLVGLLPWSCLLWDWLRPSQALQAVLDGDFTADKVACWDDKLAEVFNRGYWDGWYLGAHTPELASGYGSQATITKRFARQVHQFLQ